MEGNMILGDTILETRGLTREFKGFIAVNGVNLRVRRGSIHALIGPNGAGSPNSSNRPRARSSSTESTSPMSARRRSPGAASSARFRSLPYFRI
jgi:hypothetical protein